MALTTTNGMSIDDLGGAPNGPGLVQQLGNQVDDFYGKSVANAPGLPVAGKFPGQRVWLVDVKGWALWDGAKWITDTAWATPALGNSWTALGDPWYPPQYRRWGGYVEARGIIRNGTAGTTIFTFPSGMRPTKQLQFVTAADSGARTGLIQIFPSGAVIVGAYGTGAGNAAVTFEGVRFAPEQ
jgi:hypothetical protein